ncbi:MAG: stage II sporulation protein M [Prochlorotrichaceae cyanobacterium]|jgi:uncharacterized membrane protein SpoIIM required for sporulation
MNIKRWVARREAAWRRLENFIQRSEKRGLKSLQVSEVKEFASLYRSTTGDLARARTHQVGQALTQNLQHLIVRAYGQIYQGDRRQEWASFLQFCRVGFPAIVQETWVYTAVATAIFAIGAAISWWLSWRDPTFLELVVPWDLVTLVRDQGELWMGSILGNEPLASTNIMINNLSVSFKVIGGGVSLGILSSYILFLNGVLLGAIGCLISQNHLAFPFWAFVFPHGALELPAIFLSGGAGLLIARSLLFPGRYGRADALKVYGLKAVQLVYGIVPLLFIAGAIEGFFSPSPWIPDLLKYGAGTGILTLLLWYLSRETQESRN